MADLQKSFGNDKSPENEVRKIAEKFPEMNSEICAFHLDLCHMDLLGDNIPMSRQIPRLNGYPVKKGRESGIVYKITPEADAFSRWSKGDFLNVEHKYAKVWRNTLKQLNLGEASKTLSVIGMDKKSCTSLEKAKEIAQSIVQSRKHPFELMKLTCQILRLPDNEHQHVLKRWQSCGYPQLETYAPYAAFVLTLELFFQIAFSAGLILQKPSSYIDISYLCYLPFCMVFVSTDKLHKRCADLFMQKDQ